MTSQGTPQGKTTRVDDAYARLKAEILENRMPPGSQSLESEIALSLGMSRTPVREALVQLEADKLIELVPRHGVRVLPLSIQDMREIYEILTVLEAEAAAGVAAMRPDPAQLSGLEQATADMERAVADRDLEAWAAADDRFHRSLLDLCRNRRIVDIVNRVLDQAHRARMVTLRLRDLPERSTREHRQIMTAIASGAADEARRLFRDHRQRASAELLAILEKSRMTAL